MFRAPRHLPSLPLIVDDLGRPSAQVIAKELGVSPRTVARWLVDETAPRPAHLALFWRSRWGRSESESQAHNDATLHAAIAAALRRENEQLQQRIAHLLSIGNFGAANQPTLQGPRVLVAGPAIATAFEGLPSPQWVPPLLSRG